MEIELLIDARNVMMFSLILASGALVPEAPLDLPREVHARWERLKTKVRSIKTWVQDKSGGSFWEIDMTKFEP